MPLSLDDPNAVFQYLVLLDWQILRGVEVLDYLAELEVLNLILRNCCSGETKRELTASTTSTTSTATGNELESQPKLTYSPSIARFLAKTISSILKELPSKVYDIANQLVSYVAVDEDGNLPDSGKVACMVLSDLVQHHPLQVTSLIDYTISHVYKLLKKDTSADLLIIYLLSVLLGISQKSDVSEKTLTKLSKLLCRAILLSEAGDVSSKDETAAEGTTHPSVLLIVYFIHCLKNLLILQISGHYEQLLKFSASSTSGAKMKPETLMAQQHAFQQNLLSTHEKVVAFGFRSQFSEVRFATVNMLAHVLLSFVGTESFNAEEYLVAQYPLPDLNLWDLSRTVRLSDTGEPIPDNKLENNTLWAHDSETHIAEGNNLLLTQIGYLETLMFYMQLDRLQSAETITLCLLVDYILRKFGTLDTPAHAQNPHWLRTIDYWCVFLKYAVSELGSAQHEVLARYLVDRFASTDEVEPRSTKRESSFFGFGKRKGSKGISSVRIDLSNNPYQVKLLLELALLLVPFGVDFSAVSNKEIETESISLAEEDEDANTTKRTSYISNLLLSYLGNDNEYIRDYSLQSLVRFVQFNEAASNQLILDVFARVNSEFRLSSDQSQPLSDNKSVRTYRLFSYALGLLALIKQSKITLLQNSTIAKVLSFCTQNIKSSAALKNLKTGACWIILTALVSLYRDLEFVKVNLSQFLVFWKNLLTSQFLSGGVGADSANLHDILINLKLRTLGLACLLNYILSLDPLPELIRQLQFFLVKSHKYLLFLESSIEKVGSITSLSPQAFNNYEFNVNVSHNLIFSANVDSNVYSDEYQLVSLVLYNKKLLLQGFIKLAPALKSDVNSSIVVFLVKVFSDPRAYLRLLSTDQSREKLKNTKKVHREKVALANRNLILLEEEYNYDFGITSKFNLSSSIIDLLCLSTDSNEKHTSVTVNNPSSAPATIASNPYTVDNEPLTYMSAERPWIDILEEETYRHTYNLFVQDPLSLLLGRYSVRNEYSPALITSLVDLSIELFALVFPSLSYKIQFSLLEQLKAAATAKDIDPLRKKALLVNLTVTLHTLFSTLSKGGHTLNNRLVQLSLDIVESIETQNEHLCSILADTAGIICVLYPKLKTEEYLASLISKVVTTMNPWRRGTLLLFVESIYRYTHASFTDIFSVVSQLLRDPNPVIAFYSLKAAALLLEAATGKQALVLEILHVIYQNFLAGYYGADGESAQNNSRITHKLSTQVLSLLKVCITTLGPATRELDSSFKLEIFNLLYAYSLGVDCVDQQECVQTLLSLLDLLQELLIFDNSLIDCFPEFVQHVCKFIVEHNMIPGIGCTTPLYLDTGALFPFTTNFELGDAAFCSLVQMTKIGVKTLDPRWLNLAWIAMELSPGPGVKALLSLWVEGCVSRNWFSRLSGLFRISSRKLTGLFLELHYEQKMLPILQREKKKAVSGPDFRNEEVENIVGNTPPEDVNWPIRWEFKYLLYGLLIQVLGAAGANSELLSNITPRIQEIVRLSFLGTTAPLLPIRLRGIQLLDKILGLVGDMVDPAYPESSILEQQQAQIISALIPCFGADSDPEVIVEAIAVSSKFINLPRIKFYLKQRILKTMIYLLEEISSGKFLKFVYLESMAEYSKKAIQLAILNCWAVLKLLLDEMEKELAHEMREILNKYLRLLVLLWILVLKDLSTLRYSQPNAPEVDLSQKYWLNFVAVLCVSLDTDRALLEELLRDENGNFFFVLFCQCLEALVRGADVIRVLQLAAKLLEILDVVSALLEPDLFAEVVDLLDRLVLMESDPESKAQVVRVAETFFLGLVDSANIENRMLLELVRVTMLPLFESFPFLRQDFNGEDAVHMLSLKRCSDPAIIVLARKQMAAMVRMTLKFPELELPDLMSCVLYIFAKFYDFGNSKLIETVLPYLKLAVSACLLLDMDLIGPFHNVLKSLEISKDQANRVNYIVTMMILVNGSNIALTDDEVVALSSILIDGLKDENLASTCIQSIKTLINSSGEGKKSVDLVVREVVRSILVILAKDISAVEIDPKLAFEVIFVLLHSSSIDCDDKSILLLKVLLPLITDSHQNDRLSSEYLQTKTLALVNSYPQSFKVVVTEHLDQQQRDNIEALVITHATVGSVAIETEIQLKTFGDN